MTSSFSSPPIRCSSPGVPGIAQSRASVSGSRWYGMNEPLTFGWSANETEMSGSESTSGSSHGSEPFARYASESRKTGVRYFKAIRAASIAASKHPPGVEAATTGTGASAAREYWENGQAAARAAGQAPPPVQVPVGFTVFPGEIFRAPRNWVQKAYPTLTYFHEVDRGGHFAAWEEPELFATEIRAAFAPLR